MYPAVSSVSTGTWAFFAGFGGHFVRRISKALDHVCRPDEIWAMNFKCRPSQRRSATLVAARKSFGHVSRNFTRKCRPVVCPTFTRAHDRRAFRVSAMWNDNPRLKAVRFAPSERIARAQINAMFGGRVTHAFPNSSGRLRLRSVRGVWTSPTPVRREGTPSRTRLWGEYIRHYSFRSDPPKDGAENGVEKF